MTRRRSPRRRQDGPLSERLLAPVLRRRGRKRVPRGMPGDRGGWPLPAERVVAAPERVSALRSLPEILVVDCGSEPRGRELQGRAWPRSFLRRIVARL